MTRGLYLTVAFLSALLGGCSSPPPAGEMREETAALQDLSDLLHAAAGRLGRPPAKLADLDRQQSLFPRGYEAVKSGNVVVLWGARMKGEGEPKQNEAVAAYEKKTPAEGGYVLFTDGTIKRLTAEEFGAAPKGGKPST